MSLQTKLTSRRQFLERSAWGFGSAFLLPSLLTSCTDHLIDPVKPGVGTPGTPPLLGDDSIDWNDDAKNMVVSVIEMVPEIGDLLGGLLECLWPSGKPPVFDQIKAQIEALIDQKLATDTYNKVRGTLNDLQKVSNDYLNELQNGTASTITSQWGIARDLFDSRQSDFQAVGYEVLLLPLFAQYANMYLALLRDMAWHGMDWGYPFADIVQNNTNLANAIKEFTQYTTQTFIYGQMDLQNTAPIDKQHHIEPFKTFNNYNRQMTQTVLVFMDLWPYYYYESYPFGVTPVINREIYSDPYGTADNSGWIELPNIEPTQFPTNVSVWGGNYIESVQLTYPSGTGPNGATTTPRMGYQYAGTTQSPLGGSFNVTPDNPITQARVTAGSIVNTMQFAFNDGTTTSMMGGGKSWGADSGWIAYPHTALSSIHINGTSDYYESADLVVFGFNQWIPQKAKLNAVRQIYITSPKERSAAELAKAHPKVAIPANFITDELKAARKAHWEALKASIK